MKTALDDFAEEGREVLRVLAPVFTSSPRPDLEDPENVGDIVFSTLVALMHVCRASEVPSEAELRKARELVADDLDSDAAMQREGE